MYEHECEVEESGCCCAILVEPRLKMSRSWGPKPLWAIASSPQLKKGSLFFFLHVDNYPCVTQPVSMSKYSSVKRPECMCSKLKSCTCDTA